MSREDQSAADKARELDRIGREAAYEERSEELGVREREIEESEESGLRQRDHRNLLLNEIIEDGIPMVVEGMRDQREAGRKVDKEIREALQRLFKPEAVVGAVGRFGTVLRNRALVVPLAGAAVLLAGLVVLWQAQQAGVGEIRAPAASAAATVAPATPTTFVAESARPVILAPATASPTARGIIVVCGLPGGPACPPRSP